MESSPVWSSSPRHALPGSPSGGTTNAVSPLAAVLTVAGLVSALFVGEVMAGSLQATDRQADPPSPANMEPPIAAPPLADLDIMADLDVTEASDSRRLDTPLSVNTNELADIVQHPNPGVTLVNYSTVGQLPLKEVTYEEFAAHASRMIDLLPTLDMLKTQIPTGVFTDDIERQKQHILALDRDAEVTLAGFESFVIDERYRAFVPSDKPLERIDPKMFIVHWTGGGYDDVDHFLRVMGRLRVQYFIDKNARVYGLFDSDDERPAHALGANDFSQGVEIETGHFDDANSPVFGYTAEQITQTVYLAVDFLRRNNLPVDRTTIVGHYAADLIFSNPYYDAHTGTFSQGRIRKFDPPEELMVVIINKAQALDQALSRAAARPQLISLDGSCHGLRLPPPSAAIASERSSNARPALECPAIDASPRHEQAGRGIGELAEGSAASNARSSGRGAGEQSENSASNNARSSGRDLGQWPRL